MKIRITRLLSAAALIALAVIQLPAAAQEVDPLHRTIEVGAGAWWPEQRVHNTTMFWEACDTPATPCYHYTLDVPEGGKRLRVDLDYRDRESRWAFRVRPPGDALPIKYDPLLDTANDNVAFTGPTTMEVVLPDGDPDTGRAVAPGRYTISVAPVNVKDDTFRVRAVLDGATPPTPDGPAFPLLPNAVVVPPYNFSFDSVLDAQASHGRPPSYGDLGQQQSCSEDEKHIDEATECLRFAAGGFNDGLGPLAIGWDAGDITSGDATQTIQWSDRTTTTQGAGNFEFHHQHRHFHYKGAMQYRLFQVLSDKKKPAIENKKTETVEVGKGMKTSYCMVDYVIIDWESIDQQSAWDPKAAAANCGSVRNRPFVMAGEAQSGRVSPEYKGTIGWSRGWGDIYPYWRQGQYVEFKDAPGDGQYVVQVSFDENNNLWETDETDNVGYALIQITGYGTPDWQIETIERGFGSSPWDPNKVVIGLDELTWT